MSAVRASMSFMMSVAGGRVRQSEKFRRSEPIWSGAAAAIGGAAAHVDGLDARYAVDALFDQAHEPVLLGGGQIAAGADVDAALLGIHGREHAQAASQEGVRDVDQHQHARQGGHSGPGPAERRAHRAEVATGPAADAGEITALGGDQVSDASCHPCVRPCRTARPAPARRTWQ